jgi:hypothetical protein
LDRIFLDANVLYSPAYLELASLARFWSLDDAQLLSSAFAISTNIFPCAGQRFRFL